MTRRLSAVHAAVILVLTTSAANAQSRAPEPADGIDTITVTASRVARDGYSAPTPTSVIGDADLERRAATNVAAVLNEVPSFTASTTTQTNGVPSRSPSATYLDLRGMGASRTLVLVDGKRFVPQIANGFEGYQVDTQQVPALLVERAEVVTGGASAQWGSDAVAGVVNLVLRKKFEGLRAEAQYGQSAVGDNESRRFALMGGTQFAGGRGNVVLSLDTEKSDGVGDVSTRDWGREYWGLVTNPVAGASPRLIIAPNVQFSQYTAGGLIRDTALRGIQFGPGSTPIPFAYGSYAGAAAGSINMAGGGQPGVNIAKGSWIAPHYQRTALYGRASYEIGDALTAYAEVSRSHNNGGSDTTLPARDTALRITQDNAFLPASLRQQMITQNITSFSLGRVSYDLGSRPSEVVNDTRRYVFGLEGKLAGGWSWDAAYTHGVNDYEQTIRNQRNRALFPLAVDAVYSGGVVNGVGVGPIVCRSTLTSPNNGCQPLNVFGSGSPSAAAIGYVTGTSQASTRYTQNDVTANVSGQPFSNWAGPVSFAAGLEYRKEQQASVSDAVAAANGWEGDNSAPMAGDFNVKEGYVETVVPLLAAARAAKVLDFNAAVRYADYSTAAGGQTTWKLGLTWEPIDGLLVRAGRSRDIRAPNLYELNAPELRRQVGVVYRRANGTTFNSTVFSIISGYKDLQPEKATTTTLGFSWKPTFADRLSVSVDYYRIDLDNRIQTLAAQFAADRCSVAGDAFYCGLFTLNASGDPVTVRTPFLNIAAWKTSGIDVALNYRPSLPVLPGTLDLRLQGNYLMDATTQSAPQVAAVSQAGMLATFGGPRFRGNLSATYAQGAASVTAQARYFQPTKWDNLYVEGVDINDNSIPGATYVDLSGSYKVGEHLELFGVVNNLFDRKPPPVPAALGYPTNSVFFDMIGTTFKLGLRYKR